MKKWRTPLLVVLAAVAALAIAGGVMLLQPSGQAQASIISGDAVSCGAATGDIGAPVDALVSAPESLESSVGITGDASALSATCYFVGITRFPGGCGSQDLYVLRYLCYDPDIGWYYVNYPFCV